MLGNMDCAVRLERSAFSLVSGGMRGCPQPCLVSAQEQLGEVKGWRGCGKQFQQIGEKGFLSVCLSFSLLPLFCLLVLIFFFFGGGGGAGKSQQNFGLEKWLMTMFNSQSQWARQRRAWPKPQQCNWNSRASLGRKSCWTLLEMLREWNDGTDSPMIVTDKDTYLVFRIDSLLN